jgi:pyrimidine operon attenuation protein/uracil phosphoribosyltransferase
MERLLLLNNKLLHITLSRLARQVAEHPKGLTNTVLIGLQPRGALLANRLQDRIMSLENELLPLGLLDATFHRDDFRRRDTPLKPNATEVPFIVEGKRVILIDDVLYTGRTTRAALDALNAFGRPDQVELLVLVDRLYSRQLPIEARYVGHYVNTLKSQHVEAHWKESGSSDDAVYLSTAS